MPDKPIIFSAPMVRALLEGRKTQTRRVAKITAIMGNKVPVTSPDESLIELEPGEFQRGVFHYASTGALSGPYHLPYATGDRLYVREAFAKDSLMPNGVRYVATDDINDLRKKRPSIHMPRWASRITLTVTDVRVQRLLEISRGDAMGEGCPFPNMAVGPDPREWFRDLWNSLHGPEAWDTNPWVAAYSFTVQRGNIDQIGGAQ